MFIPKNIRPSKQWVKYLFNSVKSILRLKDPINASISSIKATWRNSYNKHYWPNSKWNQISVIYILKTIYDKIRECAHCGLYPHFMVLTGLISVRITLNVIVMYTWNSAESSRVRISKAYCTILKISQNIKMLHFFRVRFFETCAAMQWVFTRVAVTKIN